MTKMQIEMMTVEQTVERLRSLGMKISPELLRDGIEQRVFSFGSHIKSRHGGSEYKIYRRLFDEWVSARAVDRR